MFKDELAASCWDSKPFLTIPFAIIKSVERVHAIVNKFVKDNQFQFEIFLKDEYMPSIDPDSLIQTAMTTYSNL